MLAHVPAPILLPIISIGLMLWVAIKRFPKDRLHPGKLIIVVYLLMSIMSLFFNERLAPTFGLDVQWDTIVGYTLLLCLTLVPSLLIKRPDPLKLAGHALVRPMLLISGPLILFSAAYLIRWSLISFERGFVATRNALNVTGELVIPTDILTTVAVAVASYYVIYAVLFFAVLVRRLSRYHSLIAGAGTLLAIIHAAVFGARDGVLWGIYSMLLGYWMFSGVIHRSLKRIIVGIGIIAIILSLIYFGAATYERFADTKEGVFSGILGYFGSQPYVFSENVNRLSYFYGPTLRFPVIAKAMRIEGYKRTEPYQWSFGTFLTDFYGVSGWKSAIILSFLFTGFAILGIRFCQRRSAFAYSLAIALYTQFMIQGVFFFRLGSQSGNLYHFSVVCLIILIAVYMPDYTKGSSRFFRKSERRTQ